MQQVLIRVALIGMGLLAAGCSSFSSTRQLSPDREPGSPRYLPPSDTSAVPAGSVSP